MHTIWKGSIHFGLVNIPVKMFASVDIHNIRFRYLHRKCKTPIKMVRKCLQCNVEVEWADIVQGYEYEDGHYVLMEKEEMVTAESGKGIEILDFVEMKEIDPIFFDKTYYLGAHDENHKGYSLLRHVLRETNKIGIAYVTIRSKKTLAVIRVYQNCLVMETMFYPTEIRNVAHVPNVPEHFELFEKEELMARQLVDYLTTSFTPEKYRNVSHEELQKVLEDKIEKEEPVKQKTEKVIDIMAALKESLEITKNQKKTS